MTSMTSTYHYKVSRKVADLPEGFEFQPNRFIYKKNGAGCFVSYKSQDGSIKQLADPKRPSFNLWLEAHRFVDCVVDFVPIQVYDQWAELQKLGKCRLEYNALEDIWYVNFIENPKLMECLTQTCDAQICAVLKALKQFNEIGLVHNGYRWFRCKDSKVQKISDQEAEKELNNV